MSKIPKFLIGFPKVFNVFGLKVRIKIEVMPDNYAGLYEVDKKKITIHKDHPNMYEFMLTLLHELGHVLFYRVSINQSVSKEVHEYIVDNYSKMLLENFDITPKQK